MKIVSVLDDCSILFRSSSVVPSFSLRYSFDSRAKNKRRNNDGTVVDMLIHCIVKLLGLDSMKFLYIHISCVSTPFKHLEQSKTGFLDKVITDVIRMSSGKKVIKTTFLNIGLKSLY